MEGVLCTTVLPTKVDDGDDYENDAVYDDDNDDGYDKGTLYYSIFFMLGSMYSAFKTLTFRQVRRSCLFNIVNPLSTYFCWSIFRKRVAEVFHQHQVAYPLFHPGNTGSVAMSDNLYHETCVLSAFLGMDVTG